MGGGVKFAKLPRSGLVQRRLIACAAFLPLRCHNPAPARRPSGDNQVWMTATILIVALQPDTPSGRAARPDDTGLQGSRSLLPAAVHIVRCQRQGLFAPPS